jgi:hypothetical protein
MQTETWKQHALDMLKAAAAAAAVAAVQALATAVTHVDWNAAVGHLVQVVSGWVVIHATKTTTQ